MKQFTTLLFLCLFGIVAHGQDIQSINTGAHTSDDLIYSVGSIYVVPVNNPDEASSGIIAVVSRIEFLITGLVEVHASEVVNAYPNPTSNSIFLETEQETIKSITVLDATGKQVLQKEIDGKQVDISSLSPGIYFIHTDNPNIESFKIIKK